MLVLQITSLKRNRYRTPIDSKLLESKNILYCPDYVINAGGLIDVYNEMIGSDEEKTFKQLNNIYDTLLEIFIRAKEQGITTHEAAKYLAKERISRAKKIVTS